MINPPQKVPFATLVSSPSRTLLESLLALIDDEATLKRFYTDRRRRKVRLHPENDEMEDMYFDSIDIQGIVVKVIKDVV